MSEKKHSDILKARLKLLPDRMREKMLKKGNEKRLRVIEAYASDTKLRAVLRWRQRLVARDITVEELAYKVKRQVPRISEYMYFVREPSEQAFLAIDAAIYQLEERPG